MMLQILIGSVLVVLTVIIHVIGMSTGLSWLATMRSKPEHMASSIRRALIVGCLVLIMFVATLLEAVIWAGMYAAFYAVHSFERALYFSIVTYTTLGYGDIVLDEQWRLLSSLQAANGIIIFGWTTAIIIIGLNSMSKRLSSFKEFN